MNRHRHPNDIDDEDPPIPAGDAPGSRVRRVRSLAFAAVGLAIALSLLAVYVTWRQAAESGQRAAHVESRLEVLEKDLAQRRAEAAQRDADTREQVREYVCELLAQLPASAPSLQRLRTTLSCDQPGLAAALSGAPTSPSPTRPGAGPARSSPTTSGATGPSSPAGRTPNPPPTRPPAPGPPGDPLSPITDPLCTALGICP